MTVVELHVKVVLGGRPYVRLARSFREAEIVRRVHEERHERSSEASVVCELISMGGDDLTPPNGTTPISLVRFSSSEGPICMWYRLLLLHFFTTLSFGLDCSLICTSSARPVRSRRDRFKTQRGRETGTEGNATRASTAYCH